MASRRPLPDAGMGDAPLREAEAELCRELGARLAGTALALARS